MPKTHAAFCEDVKRAIESRLPSVSASTRVGLLSDVAFLAQSGVDARIGGVAPAPVVPGSEFTLSQRSKDELAPVHPKLKQCVELAIGYSTVDFRVNQGLRTVAEQKAAVAAGNSRTMHSKHLKQADGFVWAVDLVVLTNGAVDWTFNKYAAIAYAMDRAATELGIAGHIRWGCAWDRVLSDFGGSDAAYLTEAGAYAKRHAGSDLLDAPHFEWVA
jgi:peptidoglycan L-alanyl-D-glutamate endopeptidase CwlK